jgi:hypothetical protein
MLSHRWFVRFGALLSVLSAPAIVRAQQPAPASSPADQTPPPVATPAPADNSVSSSKGKHKSHANDFLIVGTVFTDKAYAFPGAHLRIRRASEKKFRWDTYTNSRGEFAVRVPQGAEYEIVVIAKGFPEMNRTVDARSGISQDEIVIRMEPPGGKK